jgi:G3E family GTPase
MKRAVTIVTGYLGSGKTTLLTHLLKEEPGGRTAVLVNEFGEVGLDHHLLRRIDEHTRLLSGGCLCCSVREDLIRELKDLLDRSQRGELPDLERVVIETSGLADPAPILFTVMTDPVLQHHYRIEHVLATVDAVNAGLHLDRHPETKKQITAADKLVVTKTDMVTDEAREELVRELARLNPTAPIVFSDNGRTDWDLLFSQEVPIASGGLAADRERPVPGPESTHSREAAHSLSVTFDRPIDWNAFGMWLSLLLHSCGENVMRVKGLLDVGERGPVLLNGVQHIIHPPEHLPAWPKQVEPRSHVVFIMKSIDPEQLMQSLEAFQHMMDAKARLTALNIIRHA